MILVLRVDKFKYSIETIIKCCCDNFDNQVRKVKERNQQNKNVEPKFQVLLLISAKKGNVCRKSKANYKVCDVFEGIGYPFIQSVMPHYPVIFELLYKTILVPCTFAMNLNQNRKSNMTIIHPKLVNFSLK